MNATEAKRRVLAVHPGAYAIQGTLTESWYICPDDNEGHRPLVVANTKDEAWIAAAAGLEERNER